MNKGEFNITKARTTLVTLDYVALSIASMSLLLSLFAACIVRIPDAVTVLKFVFIMSLLIVLKSLSNIKKHYSKKDALYLYL